jgi:hypothetical protein
MVIAEQANSESKETTTDVFNSSTIEDSTLWLRPWNFICKLVLGIFDKQKEKD